jgi:hypothetical protein
MNQEIASRKSGGQIAKKGGDLVINDDEAWEFYSIDGGKESAMELILQAVKIPNRNSLFETSQNV